MTTPGSARRRFLAALALYLVWVGVLAAMAVTTGKKPPHRLIPPAVEAPPEKDTRAP